MVAKEVNRAKAIIARMTRRGARRSKAVQKAVTNAGISVRTYRTARKQMAAIAVRTSKKGQTRGKGTWFVKGR